MSFLKPQHLIVTFFNPEWRDLEDQRYLLVPRLLGRYFGITLSPGLVLMSRERMTHRTPHQRLRALLHERGHVRQMRRMGWWRFVWAYLRDLVRVGYVNHPLEKDAWAYVDAVMNGPSTAPEQLVSADLEDYYYRRRKA